MYTDIDTAPTQQTMDWRALRPVPAPALPPTTPAQRTLPLQLLDILDFGVLLVDRQGSLLHANAAARLVCHDDAPLSLPHGQLRCSLLAQQQVEVALLAAQRGQWSMLSLRRGSASLAVAVVPLCGQDGSAAAALMLGGDGRPSRLALQFFKQNHGLTPAEAAVLDALCTGMRPSQIAHAGGVAVCTVRSQISAVRGKTGARSVGDLLRMVSGLPAIARHASQALA